jgi:hyperosmotically inducible protein
MNWKKWNRMQALVFAGLVTISAASTAGVTLSAQAPAAQAATGQDGQIQSDLAHALRDKRLRDVKAQVADGVVTLTGSVQNYEDKMDAGKKAQKVRSVVSVRNEIEVAGPTVSDEELRDKLLNKLFYDREGYPEHPFNAITANVRNGVVTLGGLVVLPIDKDSAEGLVAQFPGVKGIVDNIQVAPPSPMDDRIRHAVASAIYNYPVFTQYKIDPANPIRIVVLNGNVTLVGTVNNQGDRDQAYIRANGVPGVFKVTNNLQVAGQTPEHN